MRVELAPINQAQVDQLNEIIGSVTTVQRNYDVIISIIEEEAGTFFNGQKTADAVADIIQSRAQNYINENM